MTTAGSSEHSPGASGVRSTLSGALSGALAKQGQRREIARMGAYAMHAQYDGKVIGAKAMEGRMRRYRQQVDPTGELAKRNPQELARRAKAALNEDMARVRLAKRDRELDRARLHAMIQRTPSDDLPTLGAELVALKLNAQASQRIAYDEAALQALISAQAAHTEAASVGTEAAPAPKSRRNTHKIVSSDGGPQSVAPTRRRRQTSTPKGQPKTASSKGAEKVAKNGKPHKR